MAYLNCQPRKVLAQFVKIVFRPSAVPHFPNVGVVKLNAFLRKGYRGRNISAMTL